MKSEYFRLAVKNLRKRKLRSWLTMLGIFISIATIFVLITLSVGLEEAIREQFRMLGTDKLFIMPRGQLGGSGGGAVELTEEDVKVVERVAGVLRVNFNIISSAKFEFKDQVRYVNVMGFDIATSDIYNEMSNLKDVDGRPIKIGDSNRIELGYDFKYSEYLKNPADIRDTVYINDRPFGVVGIVGRVGNPSDDKNIYMSLEEARILFNIPKRVDMMTVQIDEGGDINEVASRIKKKLTSFRGLKEDTRDFEILTPEEILASFGIILNIITSFLIGVAAISLLVGGVGIANTMYASVLERTKEIGVMKAIGAKNGDILFIFLIESGLLGLVGGLIGVLLGFGAAKMMEYIAINQIGTTLLKVSFDWKLVLACLAFSSGVGAFSGIIPAYNASKTNTVDALRYE